MCAKEVQEDDLVFSEHGRICQACELAAEVPFSQGSSSALISSVLFSIAPFFAWYITGATWVGGISVSQFGFGLRLDLFVSGKEHVAFFSGLLAVIAGLVALKTFVASKRKALIAASAACIAVGLLHVVVRSGYVFGG
jgi:hypothetical protein